MQHKFSASLLALAAATALAAPAFAQEAKPAPLSDLVSKVQIPYESFKLDNGLTVLVNTDRKAPVVAVSVWYGVGSKNEPKGKTGFAHLFEHLMFNGSENVPGDFFTPLQQVGATDVNGTTWFDRTNYFETVPTAALDMVLMMESDRMGHLLGAVTQKVLDNQRAVVQNEKRQGDNNPYGIVEYEQLENLYPSGHPYHHSTIGSMADLDSASLDDVKGWFTDHYGPNNAVLVLSGDIDAATAKEKVAKWFGDIKPGPQVKPVSAPVPTLPATVAKTIKDQVATTRIYRMWAVPGLDNPDYLPLDLAAAVLGGLSSSRLDDALVREQKVAVSVSADAEIFAQAAQFVIKADVTPGQDPAMVAAALDAEIAKFIKEGPSQDELLRAATSATANEIRGLERTGGFAGKAPTLAEGLLYNGTPEHYRKELDRTAKMTPAEVKAAAQKWLTRPAFALTVEPGERTEGGEARGGFYTNEATGMRPAYFRDPDMPAKGAPASQVSGANRSKLPAVGQLAPLDFPSIQRATLKNGIPVYFAKRSAVPTVSVRVSFDAGYAADPKSALGTESLLLSLMDEGTQKLSGSEFARERERLGANISLSATSDLTSFQVDALSPNLGASLGLLADVVRRPALNPADIERVRTQQLTAISAEMKNPQALAARVLVPTLYGSHPYAFPSSGLGDAEVVKKLTREDLLAFHTRWFRPDTARIFVVGDTTLDAVVKMLDDSFGNWPSNRMARPVKDFSVAVPAQKARVILVDRPGSPQSFIMAGKVIDAKGTDDNLSLNTANDILGGNFLGRINMNLREAKGWTYGSFNGISEPLDKVRFQVIAPVQTDRTGDSLVEIKREIDEYVTTKGVTAAELDWSTKGSARELPGAFETSAAVLDGLAKIVNYQRPDDFYETLSTRYGKLTAADVDKAFRSKINSDGMVWVVVGDAAKVKPQLGKLGLPVEEMAAPK
ncbi:M16 family metallopeptidase [Novosphingobium taihuense]|uniref:Putative Zn-dependent peptidase n=1 Tax=Novosphingobium taihuense TaxID=260085 RepID=A0A7W7A801_9SPHN|nr:pitrilysin family protein [Novosphingobium taihuense]MBB4612088.1 putative Zn-dependent peptidase [Novosphingobium taihuense]TWH88559.1 putative Zn-dependent peptidase [Novosphingobium taihuense]